MWVILGMTFINNFPANEALCLKIKSEQMHLILLRIKKDFIQNMAANGITLKKTFGPIY